MLVAAGGCHYVALFNNGDCYTWGGNDYGQLGDGGRTPQSMPALVMREVVAISAGWHHTLVTTRFGECFAWGCNASGQLGDGTQVDRYTPVKVMDGAEAVAGGMSHSLALVRLPGHGHMGCFGWGASVSTSGTHQCHITGLAQLALAPVKVLDNVCQISAGRNHSLLVTSAGECMAWGRNGCGQLGNGTTTNQIAPQRVLDRARTVAAGLDYSLAVLEDGQCFAWGRNKNGQLGDGTTLDRLSPVKILDGVCSVTAGHCHSFAIRKDGACLGWGRNMCECVCDAVAGCRPGEVLRPVKVLEQVSSIVAGECQTIALCKTGEWQVWGRDWSGQIRSLGAMGVVASLRRPPPQGGFLPENPTASLLEEGNTIADPQPTSSLDACVTEPDDSADFVPDAAPVAVERWSVPDNHVVDQPVDAEVDAETAKATAEAAIVAWKLGPAEQHGDDVHRRLHARARVVGRAYSLRWTAYRKRMLAEGETGQSEADGADVVAPSKPPTSIGVSALAVDPGKDEVVLRAFHAELWREAAQYQRDQRRPGGNGLDEAGWPPAARDVQTGVLAVNKALRTAAKAAIGVEDLFAPPPQGLLSQQRASGGSPPEKPGSSHCHHW